MTIQTLVLPYNRISPVRIPRRDLVLGGADSLALEVSIVEYDDPGAHALNLTGGIGGPALRMLVWPDTNHSNAWDYGAPPVCPRSILWSGMGTISDSAPGTFYLHFPTATAAHWPRRCRWAMQLDWNGGTDTELLAEGRLHLRASAARSVPTVILLTDTLVPIVTDVGAQAIMVDGNNL